MPPSARLARSLLRNPPSLRPLLLPQTQIQTHHHQRERTHQYHSYETAPAPPYPPTEHAILTHALSHVPTHGFTQTSLALGARAAGFLDATAANLFPRGAFELVQFHRATQRLSLKTRVQFPRDGEWEGVGAGAQLSTGAKVQRLVVQRLRGNVDAGVVGRRLSEAVALSALASNVAASLRELAALADEIWFLAGDASVDGSWYTKRASLATLYVAAEVFQTQDTSRDHGDTERFVEDRLEGMRRVGEGWGSLREWGAYTGLSAVNVLRSKGVRI